MTGDWRGIRHILAVRLDGLGDVLMTTPAIRALRETFAGAEITLLASPAGCVAGQHVPSIERVWEYAAPWVKSSRPAGTGPVDRELIRQLAEAKFDAAVIFTVFSQSALPAALMCHLAGIPRRLAHCRENPYELLTHWVREPELEAAQRHETQRQLDLVATVGAHTAATQLELRVPSAAYRDAEKLLISCGLQPGDPWILLHPGATADSRRYAPSKFARVAQDLADLGWQIVFTGGEAERPLVHAIQRAMSSASVSLAGETSFEVLAALIDRAPLLISNNTGPVHMAAALGTPVVVAYAQTNPQHGPWQVASRQLMVDVTCRNCYQSRCPVEGHPCLEGIEPQAVVAAALELLSQVTARKPLSVA